jgi:hypothetical protein
MRLNSVSLCRGTTPATITYENRCSWQSSFTPVCYWTSSRRRVATVTMSFARTSVLPPPEFPCQSLTVRGSTKTSSILRILDCATLPQRSHGPLQPFLAHCVRPLLHSSDTSSNILRATHRPTSLQTGELFTMHSLVPPNQALQRTASGSQETPCPGKRGGALLFRQHVTEPVAVRPAHRLLTAPRARD